MILRPPRDAPRKGFKTLLAPRQSALPWPDYFHAVERAFHLRSGPPNSPSKGSFVCAFTGHTLRPCESILHLDLEMVYCR